VSRPTSRLLLELLLLLLLTAWTAWTQLRGLRLGVIDGLVAEYWVHGPQPPWAWVPSVHPPLYSQFMNVVDTAARQWSVRPHELVLIQAAVLQGGLLLLLAWWSRRHLGVRWTLLLLLLVACIPAGVRPYEQYPLARALLTVAALVWLRLASGGGRWPALAAVVISLVTVELQLVCGVLLAGLILCLGWRSPGHRRPLLGAAVVLTLLFLLTAWPGLYEVLAQDTGPTDTRGVSLGWTNPLLFLPLTLVFSAKLRSRAPAAVALTCGVLLFSAAVFLLQLLGFAGCQPFPYSFHYFVVVDPLLVLVAVMWLREGYAAGLSPRLLGSLLALVIGSQLLLYLQGHLVLWSNPHWIWILGVPWG